MNERQFWGRPISAPGPIKVEIDAVATRARVVREALQEAANIEPDADAALAARYVAECGSDEALAKLGRMLK